jgi:ADP-dependent NAD(P)H-hydrate dehydratase / NAD(P)H-hydrate epimerase
MRLVTADEMRRCDAEAIDGLGIAGLVLMETAGRAVADAALKRLADRTRRRAVIYCGGGNNGGDGFVVARVLDGAGVAVSLVLAKDPAGLSGDAAANFRIVEKLQLPVSVGVGRAPALGEGDLVVDALLGTGLDREVSGVHGALVDEIAGQKGGGATVLAVDVPSGLNADTGQPMGRCVTADATVTFGYLKRGLVLHPGARLAGAVQVADIGLPPQVEQILGGPPCRLLEAADGPALIPPAAPDAHKGSFGHVLVVAGSKDRAGAAALVCEGALRAGAGLVTLAGRPGADVSLRARLPEAMGVTLDGSGPLAAADLAPILDAAEGKDAVAFGPGIPRGKETGDLVAALLRELEIPLVLDADGLNALAGRDDAFGAARIPPILTPHPKEMARLAGADVASVQSDRVRVAEDFARTHRLNLVLKGAGTVIAAPSGETAVCAAGGPALATGGTGDVLTGIIAALSASGLDGFRAAKAGVLVHALAGEAAAEGLGRAGVLATDVAASLGEIFRRWGR